MSRALVQHHKGLCWGCSPILEPCWASPTVPSVCPAGHPQGCDSNPSVGDAELVPLLARNWPTCADTAVCVPPGHD